MSATLVDSATPKKINPNDQELYAVKLILDPIDLEHEMKIYDILNTTVKIDCIPQLFGHVTFSNDRKERILGIVLPLGYPINPGIFTLSQDDLKDHFLDLVEGLSIKRKLYTVIFAL